MKGEILSVETAAKLKRMDKVLQYIEERIHKSFIADLGIGDVRDRLLTDTVIELQKIESMLKGSDIDDKA